MNAYRIEPAGLSSNTVRSAEFPSEQEEAEDLPPLRYPEAVPGSGAAAVLQEARSWRRHTGLAEHNPLVTVEPCCSTGWVAADAGIARQVQG